MFAGLHTAAAERSTDAPPVRVLQPSQMNEDLQRLRFTLDRAHGNPYRFTSKADLDRAFDRLRASLKRPLTDLEFFRLVAPVVDAVHDSHTSIQLPPDLRRYFTSNSHKAFPLGLRYIDGRAFVEADLSDYASVPLGWEVVRIDGRATPDVMRTIAAPLAADGAGWSTKLSRLNTLFWLYYAIAYGFSDRYAVVLRDPENGTTVPRIVAGVPPKRLADWKKRPPDVPPQRLELPGEAVAVLTLDELSSPTTGEFLKDAFHRIAVEGATDLIIDVRNCPGGDDKYNNRLFSYLSDRPFRFYRGRDFRARSYEDLRYVDYTLDDFITADQSRQLPPGARADPLHAMALPDLMRFMLSVDEAEGVFAPEPTDRFAGRIYLLVSGKSSSSAAEIAALMHHLGLGTIIGEEPNGVYEGLTAGAIPILTLPNSKISVRMPLVAYHNAVMPGLFAEHGAPPAFPVRQSIADAIAGRDTVMMFARELIRERRAQR
jgi:hypothetical protein